MMAYKSGDIICFNRHVYINQSYTGRIYWQSHSALTPAAVRRAAGSGPNPGPWNSRWRQATHNIHPRSHMPAAAWSPQSRSHTCCLLRRRHSGNRGDTRTVFVCGPLPSTEAQPWGCPTPHSYRNPHCRFVAAPRMEICHQPTLPSAPPGPALPGSLPDGD